MTLRPSYGGELPVALDDISGVNYPIAHDWGLAISKGLIPGHTPGTIFGRNRDIDPASVELLWDFGGLETYLTANAELFISSTSASDTNVGVLIQGITDDYVLKEEFHLHTAGQAQQSIGNWFRVFKTIVVSGDAPLGDLYFAETDTVTAGVPTTAAKVHVQMVQGANISHKAAYTVPVNHTMYLGRIFLASRRAEDAVFNFCVRSENAPGFVEASNLPTYQNNIFMVFNPPFPITEKTDVEFRASTLTNNTQASANMGFVLVDNALA